jgi:hypothetical protein
MRTHYRKVTRLSPTSSLIRRAAEPQMIAAGGLMNVGPIRGRPPRSGPSRHSSSRVWSAVARALHQVILRLRRSIEDARPAQPLYGLATLRRSPEVSARSHVSFR